MTTKNLNQSNHSANANHWAKYDLIERELTPEQQRAKFIAQDGRFCAAMRKAIAAGMERPA